MATQDAQHEELTEELLERLLNSTSPDAYLSETSLPDRTLVSYLGELMREKGLKRADVIRASGLNPTFGYQIFSGTRRPGRDNALMLSFALGCNLRETQRLLRLANLSELWCKVPRDAIIILCIERGFSRQQTDDELYRLGEKTLVKIGA